ncbi:copper homeostasis CutC domain-containing protein [Microdochium bolleyi]|uniref:Copper homeostasis protein cutC homolog n=1 Tax=Microdochium bolleyi TaxID=196109 RepID=A0A136IUT4_9PEZI|nr:copper homeostasis CutC domain-containing protein [Microdochium bolleyi]
MSAPLSGRRSRPAALLEIPIFGATSAAAAVAAGAARLELNAAGSYPAGGTTPSVAELTAVTGTLSQAQISKGHQHEEDVREQQQDQHNAVAVPVRVMIRPRGPPPPTPSPPSAGHDGGGEEEMHQHRGQETMLDFVYTPDEVDAMETSIHALKPHLDLARGDGFVFGALRRAAEPDSARRPAPPPLASSALRADQDINIDDVTCARLVAAARPFVCVFHRAFDVLVTAAAAGQKRHSVVAGITTAAARSLPDPVLPLTNLLRRVRDLGFAGILTSGGLGNAVDHVSPTSGDGGHDGFLAEIMKLADVIGLEIIVGGGVRSVNVAGILRGLRHSTTTAAALPESVHGDSDEAGKKRGLGAAEKTPLHPWVHSSCLTTKGSENVNGDEVTRIIQALGPPKSS